MTRSLLLAALLYVLLDIARSLRRMAYFERFTAGTTLDELTAPYRVSRERPPEERN